MRHTLLAGLLALTCTFSAFAAPPSKAPPVISISCGNACTQGGQITYTGSGFKQGISVYLVVEGAGVNQGINVTIDGTGCFNTNFGGFLSYDAGSYTVTAFALSGKRATAVASTAFSVN